jgi:hypothetical protein
MSYELSKLLLTNYARGVLLRGETRPAHGLNCSDKIVEASSNHG